MKHNITPINIISASAGSGKTYTLVFHFLKTLLSEPNADAYRKMIALTFTNKAVFEMKSRILKTLNQFSGIKSEDQIPDMAHEICEELLFSLNELQYRSQQALKIILHDYAAFEIVTLDRFTYRVIRSFARDLGLSHSFEVEIQQKQMLTEVVDRVVKKAGLDKEITRLLELFTLHKFNDQLSWDISKNLLSIAELLLNENDRIPMQDFLLQSRSSFNRQHKFLESLLRSTKESINLIAVEVLSLIQSNGITKDDFARGTLFNHFEKLKRLDFKDLYKNQLEKNLDLKQKIYTTKLDPSKASSIDQILPTLSSAFHKAKELYHQFSLANDIFKQWIPMSLIKILATELELYQKESNKVLLATFNERISKEILYQATPYIYERLGEHYRYYFLDEFQDTSRLQWSNLIPLIKEPLEGLDEQGNVGSLLVVGDPKQSIYRWRGGHVEQFLALLKGEIPFQVPADTKQLKKNHRSFHTIVKFNNVFFESILPHIHGTINKNLFKKGYHQNIKNPSIGYVEIDQFHEKDSLEALNTHVQKTYDSISSALEQGFEPNEIAVLVRTKAQASSICEFLVLQKIPFLSSESLNLSHSKEVQFLVALLQLALYENNLEEKLLVVEFFKASFNKEEAYHTFVSEHLKLPLQKIFDKYGINFNFLKFKTLPLYEAVEAAFYAFELSAVMDAHLQTFLDHLFEFSQQKHNDLMSFLMHWNQQGDSLYVATPKGLNAIQILTIHKAKGLEFPVVILPFLDDPIQGSHRTQVWLNTTEWFGENLSKGWIPYSKKIVDYGEAGEALFNQIQEANELDALNVLYVAMTRPVEQLILISNLKPTAGKNTQTQDSYPGLIQNFLKINNVDESRTYVQGHKRPLIKREDESRELKVFPIEINSKKWQNSLMIQAYNQPQSKINSPKIWGILIHDLLAKIETSEDLDWVLEEAFSLGRINENSVDLIKKLLLKVINHPSLNSFFKNEYKVWNERDILIPNEENIRPDRLMENRDEMILIDYKTGKSKEVDQDQIEHYKKIIGQVFSGKKIKSYLVYIQEKKEVEVVLI